MITVKIEINGKVIEEVVAVNCSEEKGIKYGKEKQFYRVYKQVSIEPGKTCIGTVNHSFEDKAIPLAIKMLKKLK